MPLLADSHAGSTAVPGRNAAEQLWDAASLGDLPLVKKLSSTKDSELETLCGPLPRPPGEGTTSTPLHAAACAGHTVCVLALLSAGAIVDTANTAGDTAFACAGTGGHVDAMVVLAQHRATVVKPPEPPPHAAAAAAAAPSSAAGPRSLGLPTAGRPKLRVSAVQALCATGASLRAADAEATEPAEQGDHSTDTPVDSIVAACEKGDLRVLQVLTHFSSDVNRACVQTGDTGLHVAAKNGRVDLARELLRRGALVATQDHQGFTPLHIAVMREEGADSNSHTQQLVELLLHYHGAVTLEDHPGSGGAARSVHSTAVSSHNPRIAGMLHARTSAAKAQRTAAAAAVARRVRDAPEDPAAVRRYFVQKVLDTLAVHPAV